MGDTKQRRHGSNGTQERGEGIRNRTITASKARTSVAAPRGWAGHRTVGKHAGAGETHDEMRARRKDAPPDDTRDGESKQGEVSRRSDSGQDEMSG